MSTEILVNIGAHETRVALVEGGSVQEVFVQRAARHGLTGNIYQGRVERVLPGMQAAFVEIGLERTAFLHASDMQHPQWHELGEPPVLDGSTRAEEAALIPRSSAGLPINQLLREGQDVLVQVLKDPLGTKGARLTTMLSLASRYLVLLPRERNGGTVGVSARIEDEPERERLRQIMQAGGASRRNCPHRGGRRGRSLPAQRPAVSLEAVDLGQGKSAKIQTRRSGAW